MKSIKVVGIVDEQPVFDKPLKDLLDQCEVGGIVQILNSAEYISYQQIKYWKGVLLPALAKDTGDSIQHWETTIKLKVLPDDFQPEFYEIQGQLCARIPSITKLGMRKMNQLIEGAVAYCRDECGLTWLNLPDKELRK